MLDEQIGVPKDFVIMMS